MTMEHAHWQQQQRNKQQTPVAEDAGVAVGSGSGSGSASALASDTVMKRSSSPSFNGRNSSSSSNSRSRSRSRSSSSSVAVSSPSSSSAESMSTVSSSHSNTTPPSDTQDIVSVSSGRSPFLAKWTVPVYIRRRLARQHQHQQAISGAAAVAITASRACADCKTTHTPLWRSGPNGPKSLCNACGIRYRKRRKMGLLDDRHYAAGVSKNRWHKRLAKKMWSGFPANNLNLYLTLNKGEKIAEEEEAAVLLVAISQGLVW